MAVTAIHPGEHLAEELRELRMSAADLARKLDVPTNRITGILNAQRAITGDTALRLAHYFGSSPEFWLNLQSLYELRVAQKKIGRSIKALPRRACSCLTARCCGRGPVVRKQYRSLTPARLVW